MGKNGKVNVYIVAEAFCPNRKEHSDYMDKLLMTPQGEKSGVRNIMNIYMEQMVLDGWDSEDNTGICEKGKYDCELAKYNLCSEVIDNSVDNHDQHMWWDFVRCNYKHQDEILEMYKLKHVNEKMIGDITETCATDAGVDYDTIKTCATSEMGTNLLQGSYKRVSSMSMPVWIYVEGQKFAMHEDWISPSAPHTKAATFRSSAPVCNFPPFASASAETLRLYKQLFLRFAATRRRRFLFVYLI